MKEEKLTFLIGAGCSIDPPSCLPAGMKMMEAIIKHTCIESEQEKLLSIAKSGKLRFESLIEIIRENLDDDLNILDYYGLCDKPNFIHFFLAEMIKQGNFVMTTNFDFLIEHALLQLEIPKEDIIPVITKEDFQKYDNPLELFKDNKKPIYKLHGSTKNIISEESTRDSLIATIRAFGLNKEGRNIFQVEPFKLNLFNNISNERTLVVMGYSGSDDFDIVPTLRLLKNLRKVIWVNHTQNLAAEKVNQIKSGEENVDKTDRILNEIKNATKIEEIYRINMNTIQFIKKYFNKSYILEEEKFDVNLLEWLKLNIKADYPIDHLYIASRIYYLFDLHDDALKCTHDILRRSIEIDNKKWEFIALANIGYSFFAQGKYNEAFEHFKKASRVTTVLGDTADKAAILMNIGQCYNEKEDYANALRYYELALEILKKSDNSTLAIALLDHIATIYKKQGKIDEAMKFLERAVEIAEEWGELAGISYVLANMAHINMKYLGKEQEALNLYLEAIEILEKLGDLTNLVACLNDLSHIYRKRKDYYAALDVCNKALYYSTQIESVVKIVGCNHTMGLTLESLGKYYKALEFYELALKILDENDLFDFKHRPDIIKNIERVKSKIIKRGRIATNRDLI